jgi:hypothetical protein
MKTTPLIKNIVGSLALLLASVIDNGFGASPAGDVVGKVTVGYQGWFACIGDGQPTTNWWWHWSNDWNQTPSPSNTAFKAYPDVREYATTFPISYPNLGNGQPAALYSCYTQQTLNTQFLWMQQNNIDTAALQRFNPNSDEGPLRDAIATKVKIAAESTGRKFYIMYDSDGWTNIQSEIKADWTNKMKALTTSSAYAKQNGKAVVCIFGFGYNNASHPWTPAVAIDIINWFKSQNCYVIGGVPREWRTGTGGSRSDYGSVYHTFNMISPWMVGAIGSASDSDGAYATYTVSDQADCNANGIDYQPCVLPGDLSIAGQRAHGDFMWRQFYNMVRAGCQGIYVSMFDEYGEGNQIAKTAENSSQKPVGSNFRTLDEDGTACSSDYYLRLTGDGGRMLKGQISLTSTRPTPTTTGTVAKKLNPGASVSLIANANGKYVCADNSGTSPLIANRTSAGSWEHYVVVDAGGGQIALRATANNMYVCADNGGSSALIANRATFGFWESFTEVDAGGGKIGLRASANNSYVTAENGGTSPLIANRPSVGSWESFTVAP